MKFKLNGFEKFIIGHKTLTKMLLLAVYFVLVFIAIVSEFSSSFVTLYFILFIFLGICINVYPNIKGNQLLKIHNEDMDMISFLDGTNQMIVALNPKDIPFVSQFCNNRITALYNIGEYDIAENEIRMFWQSFDLRKVPVPTLVSTHISMAMHAISNHDEKAYNEQMRIIEHYRQRSQKKILVRNGIDYAIRNLQFYADAKMVTKNVEIPYYEENVLAHLKTNPINNKPRKKDPSKLETFSAYCKLFIYYKNTENTSKATYYAQQLINIGNEQLAAYRKAKEYLENGNSSN